MFDMRRREFITLLGGAAAAWPLAARAQQPAMPVIGFLHGSSLETNVDRLRGFHRGLKNTGYVEGENVTIVYRWAENQIDRLPELAADLVRRQVAVITAVGGPVSVLAAKEATTTIPIVFNINEGPVKLGLVASLSRPGGNLTGINFLSGELVAKRLELLHQLVPAATRLAVLVNPVHNPIKSTLRGVEPVARALGLQIQVLNASTIPRDRCCVRDACERATRRPFRRRRPLLPQQACPIGQLGVAPRDPPRHIRRATLPKSAG